MKNQEIATLLREIADFLEIKEVEYKPWAYRRAARTIASLSEDIEDIHEQGKLEEIEGVGESIAEKIAEYLETGDLAYYRDLRADLPIDIEALTRVEGVGPTTAKRLYQDLGVQTLEDLERAAREGKIAELEGFGETSQQNILDHIERAKAGEARMLLGRAFPIADTVEARLEAAPAFDRVDIVGSFRRRRPTVGDIDILAAASDPEAAMEAFCTHDDVNEVRSRGDTKASVVVSGGLQMDLRLVEEAAYGAAMIYFTGSKDHNIALRNRAIDQDRKLNEYGLFEGDDTRLAGATEQEVYEALGLAWIPPELREDTGEVAAAAAEELPTLVTTEDIRGDLQMHTEASDGAHSVQEMAVAAAERGHEYVLITDHGPNAPIPDRLDRESFADQQDAVKTADEALDIAVRQGIEAEITAEGLGLSETWLDACDAVVAGLHSRPDAPTEWIVDALTSYPIDVLAHPTTRLINEREPLDLDLSRVMATAADEDVAIEINAQPKRLDLDWALVKEYRETVSFVVNTDAHTTGELDHLHRGVAQARRGWCESADVLNTTPIEELAFIG